MSRSRSRSSRSDEETTATNSHGESGGSCDVMPALATQGGGSTIGKRESALAFGHMHALFTCEARVPDFYLHARGK